MRPQNQNIEFSRPFAVDKIPASGSEQEISANQNERAALAERFGLLELPKLQAKLRMQPAKLGKGFDVTGTMVVDAVQQCVVTLEPLPVHIEHDIDVHFANPAPEEGEEIVIDPESKEAEPIVDGAIDLGDLVAQELALALDPYPRKPGLAFVEAEYGDAAPAPGPLAELAVWQKKPKE